MQVLLNKFEAYIYSLSQKDQENTSSFTENIAGSSSQDKSLAIFEDQKYKEYWKPMSCLLTWVVNQNILISEQMYQNGM